jgi:hypothetical protein
MPLLFKATQVLPPQGRKEKAETIRMAMHCGSSKKRRSADHRNWKQSGEPKCEPNREAVKTHLTIGCEKFFAFKPRFYTLRSNGPKMTHRKIKVHH